MSSIWSRRVVDALCEERRSGEWDFHRAWDRVTTAHPPRGRDRGEERPHLFEPGEDEPAETMADFLYRACADAWYGRRPALRHLTVDLLSDAESDLEWRAGRLVA